MAIENATLYQRSDMRCRNRPSPGSAHPVNAARINCGEPAGEVIYANRRMEELTGCSAEEMHQHRGRGDGTSAGARGRTRGGCGSDRAAWPAGGRVEFAADLPEGRRYLRLRFFGRHRATSPGPGRIVQDVTQRHEVDRMKSSLISTVSHELRTPLAAVKGMSSTLLADDAGTLPASEKFLQVISDESDRLSVLVNDPLDMSRIEAGTPGSPSSRASWES